MLRNEKSFYKSFITMTLVIAMQNAIVFGVNLADSIMLGVYSEASLSGVFLVNQIQFMLQMLVNGVGEAMLIFSSRSWGENNVPGIHKYTNLGMRFALLFSCFLFAVCFIFPEGVLRIFSDSEAFVGEGTKYLRIVCFTYPIFAITNILIYMLRSVETTKIGFYVSLFALFFNVILNYVLIFGKFGFPELGVRGAAIATLVSRVAELVFAVFYSWKVDKKVKIKLRVFFEKTEFKLVKDFVRTGFPVFLSGAAWGVAMSVQTAILGHMGDTAVSANSIATTLFQIVTVFTYGSASASAVVIGKARGEGKKDKMKPYAQSMQIMFLIIGLITGLLIFVLKEPIVSLYDVTAESASMALSFLTILSVTSVGTSYQMPVLTGIVRAGGETDFVFKNDFIFMWLIVIPASLVCGFFLNLSPIVVFICLKSDQILKCAVAAIKVNRYKWIKDINS